MAEFNFLGKSYKYFVNPFNDTRHNERAVEVALGIDLLERYRGRKSLEVGTVLPNYHSLDHTVVDKYDEDERALHLDILYYYPAEKFDLILSISTLEHIGWDSGEERGTYKVIKVIKHMRELLKPNGLFMATFPLGYNSELDQLVKDNKLDFDELYFMKRDDYNGWNQVSLKEAVSGDYSREQCTLGAITCQKCGVVARLMIFYVTTIAIGYIGRRQ